MPSSVEGAYGHKWVEVYHAGEWKPISMFQDYSVKMNFQFFSKKPTELKAPISESIEIPLDDRNKEIFGIDVDTPIKVPDLEYRITDGTEKYSEGVMRVDKFRWNGLNNNITVQLEDVVGLVAKQLKKDNVSEFITDTENKGVGYYHHWLPDGNGAPDIATTNSLMWKMIYHYQNTLGDGFESSIYSHRPDYEFDTGVATQSMQPVYNVKNILNAMFNHVGVGWNSEAFDDLVYTTDRGNHEYPMSELWMSLPCRWIAKTTDNWSGSSVLGGESPVSRRTWDVSYYRSYQSPTDHLIFGEASLGYSGTPEYRWMLANEMKPFLSSGASFSNSDPYSVVNTVVPSMENNGNANRVVVCHRPAKYTFNFSSFSVPAFTVKSWDVDSGSIWNQFTSQDLTDVTGGAGAPFYWQLTFMIGNKIKRFRVSPYLYASGAVENGVQVLKVPSTTIQANLIDSAKKFLEINDVEQLVVMLLPVAAPEARVNQGGSEFYGGELNANVSAENKLVYKYDTTFPQGAFFNLEFSPFGDSFPIIPKEIPNVKASIRAAYPEMKMWDLMAMILERFNLQVFYDIEANEVRVDNVYRNGWKKNVDLSAELQRHYLFDGSKAITANVRADSIRLISAVNTTFLSTEDKADGTDSPVASTIDYEIDPDGDSDIKLSLKSGVFTGSVHGPVKTAFDDRTHEISELLLAGASFVEEAKVDNYGIRFGFLGESNIGDDFERVSMLQPKALRNDNFNGLWEKRPSYLSIGEVDLYKINYRKVYYDGTPELDYIISCGMESGVGSGSDHSAYELFHEPLYNIMHSKPMIECGFTVDIEDMKSIKLGSVLDFGYGLFGITSISSVEVIEGKTAATASGYIL